MQNDGDAADTGSMASVPLDSLVVTIAIAFARKLGHYKVASPKLQGLVTARWVCRRRGWSICMSVRW